MCCLDQTCSVVTLYLLALRSQLQHYCDVIFVTTTTSILSGPYTVFPTRGLSFQILIVRRDHTQFSHPLLINVQWIQCSIHLNFPHISTILTLRSLPTNKVFCLIGVRKRLTLESSQFATKRSKHHLLVLISLSLLCWLWNQLSLTIFRILETFPTVEVGETWLQEPLLFTGSRQQPLLLPSFKGAIPSSHVSLPPPNHFIPPKSTSPFSTRNPAQLFRSTSYAG